MPQVWCPPIFSQVSPIVILSHTKDSPKIHTRKSLLKLRHSKAKKSESYEIDQAALDRTQTHNLYPFLDSCATKTAWLNPRWCGRATVPD